LEIRDDDFLVDHLFDDDSLVDDEVDDEVLEVGCCFYFIIYYKLWEVLVCLSKNVIMMGGKLWLHFH
jgi:hypothetical protein